MEFNTRHLQYKQVEAAIQFENTATDLLNGVSQTAAANAIRNNVINCKRSLSSIHNRLDKHQLY